MLAVARHAKTKDPVDKGCKDISFCGHAQPDRVHGGLLHAAKEIEQPDDDHQAGIFEEGNDCVDQSRDNQLESLWKNDQPLRFPVTERQ